jgi:hypothetical protein
MSQRIEYAKYETGWSLEQCDEAAHVFHAYRHGIERSLAHDFHEWCESEGLPKAERNKVWECLAAYVEYRVSMVGYSDEGRADER